MRNTRFIVFFLFPSIFCYSQDTLKHKNLRSRFSISFDIGENYEQGGDTHYANEQALIDPQTGNPWSNSGYSYGNTYAEQGISASTTFDYHFKKHKLILFFSAGYSHVPFDINNYASILYMDQGIVLTNLHATDYDIMTLLPGVKYPIYLGKFTFYFQCLAGIIICRTPNISFTEFPAQYSSPAEYVTLSSGTGTSFALNLGAGIEYHIIKHFFIKCSADADLCDTDVPVSFTSTPDTYPLYGTQKPIFNLPLGPHNLKLGAGFEF